MIVATSATGAIIGLLLGTSIKPEHISLMFSLIFTPLIFTGCTYYPWAALYRVRWYQIVTLINPLTYCSEGLRYSMAPPFHGHEIPTLGMPWIIAVLIVANTATFIVGTRTFLKRVVN
jgi:ABC-2 type transport system permease protein